MKSFFPISTIVIASFYLGIAVAACSQFKADVEPRVFKIDPIKVMVIDTGILDHPRLKPYVKYDDSDNYKSSDGHGTHVAGIIALGNYMTTDDLAGDPLCPEVEIYSCKFYEETYDDDLKIRKISECVERATREKMDYINFSAGGYAESGREYNAFKHYVNQGGTVIVAAGNKSLNLVRDSYYPASYAFDRTIMFGSGHRIKKPGLQNFIIVSAADRNGSIVRMSNKHPKAHKELGVDVLSTLPNGEYGYMTGTSQAAPAILHTILRQKCQQNFNLQRASK